MTQKLYYEDSFQSEFTAVVTSMKKLEGDFHITLTRTAFYPEGGGQPADKGKIGGSRVEYVYEDEGEIYHVLQKLPRELEDLDENVEVECEVDWERRFDFMQQHTGQHLLSAAALNLYGAETVGFHLGETNLTIDTDIALKNEQIQRLEMKANEMIYADNEVEVDFPDQEDLKKLDLRKQPEVDKDIRVIRIGGCDVTPCGGTHVNSTGQVGIIKVLEAENYKGGSRLHFLCGKRALQDYRFRNQVVAELRDELSISEEEIIGEVSRLQSELAEKEQEIADKQNELRDYEIEELLCGAKNVADYKLIKQTFEDKAYDEVKYMAEEIVEYANNIVIFAQKEAGTARMILARSENISEDLDMNEIIGDVLEIIDGNGGGHELLAQGGGDKVEKLAEAAAEAEKIIKSWLD